MSIKIEWKTLLSDSEEWDHRHVLYAYVNPHTDEIIYVGMAWHRTVRQRFRDRDKNALHDYFLNELEIEGVEVIVGSIYMDGRLTRQLLANVRRGFVVQACDWNAPKSGRTSVLDFLICARG